MIVAYISFDGAAEAAFSFYKSVLGGEFTNVQRFADTPQAAAMPEADRNKIMHIALKTADGAMLMGNDHVALMGDALRPGNNFSLSIHPAERAEAKRLFDGLSAGGNVIVPLEEAPWGDYFGMFMDKFGMKWMINCTAKA